MAKRGRKPRSALSGIADLRVIGHPSLRLSLPGPEADQLEAYERTVFYALWMQRQHRNKRGWWKFPHDPLKCFFCRSLRQLPT